jgi:hypothetical protein
MIGSEPQTGLKIRHVGWSAAVCALPVVTTVQPAKEIEFNFVSRRWKLLKTKFVLPAAGSYWLQFLLWITTVSLSKSPISINLPVFLCTFFMNKYRIVNKVYLPQKPGLRQKVMKEDWVPQKGKSFAECMVQYAREGSGGRGTIEDWKSFTMNRS